MHSRLVGDLAFVCEKYSVKLLGTMMRELNTRIIILAEKKFAKKILGVMIFIIYFIGLFSHGMQNMDNFVIWTRDFVHGNLLAEYHINSIQEPGIAKDLTVPYTPLSLYLIGLVAQLLLIFLPDNDSTYILSVNLTSVIASLGIFLILRKWNTSSQRLPAWVYLASPGVFLATPILGYQDSIMTFFIVLTIIRAQQNALFASGALAGAAIMSKQLAAIPMFGIFVAILLSKPLMQSVKWLLGALLSSACVLIPFIATGNLFAYFKSQSLASVHTMLFAQGANFPWFASLIYRLFTLPFDQALRLGGDVLEISPETIRRITYLLLSLLSVLIFVVWAISNRNKNRNQIQFFPKAAAIMYLSYYLFAAGVHENHIYPVLAILFLVSNTRSGIRIYFLANFGLSLHLLNYYSLGRSFSMFSPIRESYPLASILLVIISIILLTTCLLETSRN